MRKFLLKLMAFMAMLVGVLVLFEIGFRQKPTAFKNKYEGLTKYASDVEVLVLGHSHANEGVNPRVFSLRTYNMAMGFQNVHFDNYILGHFIDRMDSLKCVVIATSYYHFFNTLPDLDKLQGENLFNTVKYHLYWNVDSVKDTRIPSYNPRYNLEIFNNPATSYLSMFSYYLRGEAWDKETKQAVDDFCRYGFGQGQDVVHDETFLDTDGLATALAHAPHYTEAPVFELTYNYGQYEHIVQLCHEKGVKVAIVLFPCWHSYADNLDTYQLSFTRRMMRQLASEYDNCVAWDFLQDERFVVSDFHDAIHLNKDGAIKMGYILDEQINALLQ